MTIKNGSIIPKKASKHSQGSVARPEKDRHKAYFSLKPQEWDKEKDKQIKCKPPNVRLGKSAGFEKVLYQLLGNEPPEMWILWKKDLNNIIVTSTLDWDLIFPTLLDISDKAAKTVIYDIFYKLNYTERKPVKLTWGDYGPFRNKATQKKLLTFGTNQDGTTMNEIEG